jgi:uncharacterized protein
MTESILWRRLDLPGQEIATLEELDHGWRLSGTALFSWEQGPVKLDYTVVCDPVWRTHSAEISGVIGDRRVNLIICAGPSRRWHLNGVACAAVEGCIDIDLGFSPSTNLLPVRRLSLAVGEEAMVRAAWLPFPSLEFAPLDQLYRREAETAYRYESDGGAFVKMLEVNAIGFVTSYPGVWQAESEPVRTGS